MIALDRPSRPALRYHGSKWRAAPWIITHLPDDHDVYVEPFGGSAAVLLQKTRSPIEVYNDLDGDVVNFFRLLREQPDELIRAIYWTPFAHAEYQLSREPTDDPLEAARRFYVRSHLTISGPTAQWNSGWRRQTLMSRDRSSQSSITPAARTFMQTEHLLQVAERLRGVTIECADALEIIRRYDHPRAVFYIDPPYVRSTRSKWRIDTYRHELTDEQHRALAAILHECRGMIVVSGYHSPLYAELYPDWQQHERDFRTNGNTDRMATETLWLNPAAVRARDGQQLSLFSKD